MLTVTIQMVAGICIRAATIIDGRGSSRTNVGANNANVCCSPAFDPNGALPYRQ